jgi:hypothetical protein
MIPWLFGEVGAANVAPIPNVFKSQPSYRLPLPEEIAGPG